MAESMHHTGHLSLTVVIVLVVILCLASSVNSKVILDSSSVDLSYSVSSSASLPVIDRIPCVFRGSIKSHGEEWKIDACAECKCKNGTSDCDVIFCSRPTCDNPVTIEGECCLLCPDTDESISASFSSFSQSSSIPIFNRIPCVFRGVLRAHTEQWKIDACTECKCTNGTTDCDIITCFRLTCNNPVTIAGECCPLCPYKMELFQVFNMFPPGQSVTEASSNRIILNAEVEIFKSRTSRRIRGENMWKISAWVSSNHDGSGTKYSYKDNILSERQTNQEFSKAKGDYFPPDLRWNFNKLKYDFNAWLGGLCKDFRFLCIKFDIMGNPRPQFDLGFTFSVYQQNYSRQTSCVRLGVCKGVLAESFNWELSGENPIPGEETPVSIDIDVTFHLDTRNLTGDGLWRVAIFGSRNPDGGGPRYGEVTQVLNNDEASADLSDGGPLEVDGIKTEFDIGTIGCVHGISYVCMEFLKGDAPNPDFTLIVEGGLGDVTRDSLVVCKQQECQVMSQSMSHAVLYKRPCDFQGIIKLHRSKWTADACTKCKCKNGTTECDSITCRAPKCVYPIHIDGKCCPICPYKMELFQLFNMFPPGTSVTEGNQNHFNLDAEVEIFKRRTSGGIRGENMWKISAWVSSNEDGSGTKYSYQDNILSEKQKGQEFSKAKLDYSPPELRWTFKKLEFIFNASEEGLCKDFNYFCINFDVTENPRPKFDLDFTFSIYQEEYFRQNSCVRLGACNGT